MSESRPNRRQNPCLAAHWILAGLCAIAAPFALADPDASADPDALADSDAPADSGAEADPPLLRLTPCQAPADGENLLCGTLEVFEDRRRQAGRKIPLKIVVMPSDEGRSDRALFLLAGGPGVAATEWGPGFVGAVLADIRQGWDIVLVDQRGTGSSNALDCQLYDANDPQTFWGDLLPVEAIRRCRQTLEKRADLSLYGTAIAADDLDDVRAALGYSTIDLYGSSYGSYAALVYLERHPQRVRSLILQGVAPTTVSGLEEIPRAAQAALDRLMALCIDDQSCSGAYPNLEEDLATVFERLRGGPLKVDVTPPGAHGPQELELTYGNFALVLRGLLHHAPAAGTIPRLITAAAAGDFEPFVAPSFGYRRSISSSISFGMFLSVFCEEQVRPTDLAAAAAAAEKSFAGAYWAEQLVRACALWPRGTAAVSGGGAVRSQIPALLISGGLDPATPPHWARSVASDLPRSHLLEVPYASHSFAGMFGCVEGIVADFLERGSETLPLENSRLENSRLETSCLDQLEPPSFALP